MRLHLLTLILSLFLSFSATSQKVFIDYVDATLEIASQKRAKYKVTKKWTIYNAEQKEEAYIFLPYNSFSSIRSIELTIYDKDGLALQKAKKGDFFDQSLSRGFEITNSRALYYKFESSNYPFTIELSYEYNFNGLLFLPPFTPIEHYNCELDKASLKVICPKDYQIRYKSNKASQLQVDTNGNELSYHWTFSSNKYNGKQESFAPFDDNELPFVLLAPSDFEIYKTKGSQRSWREFGDWVVSLNEGRQDLPNETVEILKANFDSITDFRKKVAGVYAWMQNRTRYVSIQEGLGGWQPFSAVEVDKNGYGDCKALVNYAQSALQVVGIESFYTLIQASNRKIDTSFCHQVFNHAILSVPSPDGDTIWLECTSQHLPANFLLSPTSGKYALLIKQGTSQLVKTPNFTKSSAIASSKANINLLTDGEAEIDLIYDYRFYLYENMLSSLFETKNEQKRIVEQFLSLPSADIEDVVIKTSESPDPTVHLSSNIIAQGFYTSFAQSVAFAPNFFKSTLPDFPYDTQRNSNIEIKYNFSQIDTVVIKIPSGFEIDFIPEAISTASRYGSYSVSYTSSKTDIQCIFNQKLSKGIYSKKEYQAIYDFQQSIQTAFNRKIVIKVSET